MAGQMLAAFAVDLTIRSAASTFPQLLRVEPRAHAPWAGRALTSPQGPGHTVIATLFTQNRTAVTLAQVPSYVVRALVDTEDKRFFQHHGVDLRGLLRAAVHDGSGGGTQGGSTLTMQYIKQERYYQATSEA